MWVVAGMYWMVSRGRARKGMVVLVEERTDSPEKSADSQAKSTDSQAKSRLTSEEYRHTREEAVEVPVFCKLAAAPVGARQKPRSFRALTLFSILTLHSTSPCSDGSVDLSTDVCM